MICVVHQHREARGRAERLEGGDHAALAIEIGAHRIGDADTADDQCCQADQRQELREAFDIGAQRWRGIGAGANVPACIGEISGSLPPDVGNCCIRRTIRQGNLVDMIDKTTGLDEAGSTKAIE